MANTVGLEIYHILWYFILYAFLGWCLEVVFCSVDTGKFVNRGFLNGPLCPIYGFGGVIIVTTLQGLQDSWLLLFAASVVLCSLLELVAGFLLKKLFHTSWWDYSDQPFNIGGYVCLKFSLLWGLACLVLMRIIHPGVEALVDGIPTALGWVLLAVLYVMLLVDLALTVAAVAKLNRDLREITRLTESLRKPSEALAKTLGNSAISMAGKIETKLEESDTAASLKEKAGDISDRVEELLKHRTPIRSRLLAAFPDMKSLRYHGALEKLLERLHPSDKESEQDSQD